MSASASSWHLSGNLSSAASEVTKESAVMQMGSSTQLSHPNTKYLCISCTECTTQHLVQNISHSAQVSQSGITYSAPLSEWRRQMKSKNLFFPREYALYPALEIEFKKRKERKWFMLDWAVVWKEKRRKETKQKHWPIEKRKQERKRTKHPVHSSQSVEEGGSVSSAFLCWSGHGQPGSSLHYSTTPYLAAHLILWFLLFIPELVQKNQSCFQTFPPLQMPFHDSSVASAGCATSRSSSGMSIMDPRSPESTDRCKLTFPCSKVRGHLWAWGCILQSTILWICEWADKICSLNWSWVWA